MAIDYATQDTNTKRPYAPASNVIAVLQRLRSRNLPERIDTNFLVDAGITESLVQRVESALEFLNLVHHDVPTPALRSISTSTDEEYRSILAGLIRDAYSEVFAVVDPAEDDQDRILNVFRRYSPASQRARMVSFFLGMCREAGIPVLDAPRQRAMGESGRPTRPPASRATSGKAKAPTRRSAGGRDEQDVAVGIHPALEVLIRSLQNQGETMSAVQRKRWLDLAEAALAFAYPEPIEQVNKEPEFDEEDDAMSP